MPKVEVGRKVPDFTLTTQRGEPFTLSEQTRTVVLFFYPEDDSPACTGEACDFRDLRAELEAMNAIAVGISPDDQESHAAFESKYKLGMTLLVDERGPDGAPKLAKKLGAWGEKLNYGKTYVGLIRTTYVIAPGRVVVARFDNVRAKGHAGRVVESSKAQSSKATNKK
ncbi:MAG: peroxiredoxin [Phycisphaerales bacterium]